MDEHEQLERWLRSEDLGDDEGAEAAFAQLFTALPKAAPGTAFLSTTVDAILRQRANHRRTVALAWAASVFVGIAAVLVAYVFAPFMAQWTLKFVATATGHSVPWLISYSTVALDWWWTLGRIGGTVASAIATPARATALVGVELIGLLAFFALQKVARAETLGDAQV